jgi:dTDP-4-amino-4,6-dideoxygalactose transaminase
MTVRFLDVPAAYREVKEEIDAAVARVLDRGAYILGPEVAEFERAFADYVGAAACIGVGNGLDALTLALEALGIGGGDEVIVPSNTFIATWLAVSRCGATPVPVEPVPATGNIDPTLVEAAISEHTKAIVPVHLYGQAADLDPILVLARTLGLHVVEDAAQAHGARYKGTRIGAHGDAVAWSFYPGKNLGALGDAGAITTNDVDLADRLRVLGNYGSQSKHVHHVQGVNSRMDSMQAAMLSIKLKCLDAWNERRRRLAEHYQNDLVGSDLQLPSVPSWAEPVWHLYAPRYAHRDALRERLLAAGIECLLHYPTPPHLQGAYAGLGIRRGALPIAERIADETISLPIGPHLSLDEAAYVVDQVQQICRSYG